MVQRDPALRDNYLVGLDVAIRRLLGAIDRNPYRPTYGCLDRQFWHYRTAGFPSQMYQEGVLPLALVHAHQLPGNRWHGNPRVKELAAAGIRFAARSSHRDGSCDDYYPFERAMGAAVFSLVAAARAYQVLGLEDLELVEWLKRRASWLIRHGESGRLANHHAAAALGLLDVAQITGDDVYRRAAEAKVDLVLSWQDKEGWFDEYGGADPGYQTVTIDCLAQYRTLTRDETLDEPLGRAVEFARYFLHPDHSYGGEYGSRGTYHFYPHGMELLVPRTAAAADLADGFLKSVAAGTEADFSDDRLFTHRLASRIEAWLDWAVERPEANKTATCLRYFPHAGMLVYRDGPTHTVVSAARGGIFKHFGGVRDNKGVRNLFCEAEKVPDTFVDAGLIVQTESGRLAVSQGHDRQRHVVYLESDAKGDAETVPDTFCVSGPLHWCRWETATPLNQALLHLGMLVAGRCCRTLVRRWLQRRLITGRRESPIRLTRTFEFPRKPSSDGARLRVTDVIELAEPSLRVRRMAFGTDHQAAYVAASGIYQQSVLAPWTNLSDRVDELNARRSLTIVREFPI